MIETLDSDGSEDLSARFTTGVFDLSEAGEAVDRIAALAGEEANRRKRLEEEIAALCEENTRLSEANARLAEANASLQRFAEIGRREYEALRRGTQGKIRALLMHRSQEARFKQLEKRLDDPDLDFQEMERIHARVTLELGEIYSTRPEAQSTGLSLNLNNSPADWSVFQIGAGLGKA